MRIKFSFLAVFIFSALSAFSQVPTGLPMTNSKGWIKYAYLQADSGNIPARRDTNFTARYPTIVYWENSAGSDTSFWVSNGRTSGRKWVKYGAGWSLTGNAGTSKTGNFIGTTDINPIVFKVNNVLSGLVDTVTYNTALGYGSLNATTTGLDNVAIGYKSMHGILDGFDNTAVGYLSMQQVQNGNGNTGMGYKVLSSLTDGEDNAAYGDETLQSVSTGSGNAVFGNQAGKNITGNSNTSAGNSTFTGLIGGSFNTALGNGTGGGIVSGSNNTIIGARVTGLAANLNNNILIADGTGTIKIKADSSGAVFLPLLGAAGIDTTSFKPLGINTSTKEVKPLTYWPGGGGTATASNGLTKTGDDIALGGTLSVNTLINGNAKSLTIGLGLIDHSTNPKGVYLYANDTLAAGGVKRTTLGGRYLLSTHDSVQVYAGSDYRVVATGGPDPIIRANASGLLLNSVSIGTALDSLILQSSSLTIKAPIVLNNSYGSSGQVLTSTGAGGIPSWQTPATPTNYWTLTGSNISNNTGTNVGIGTTTPISKLQVAGSVRLSDTLLLNDAGYGPTYLPMLYKVDGPTVRLNGVYTEISSNHPGGNVRFFTNGGFGIMTAGGQFSLSSYAPTAGSKLHVEGAAQVTGNLAVGSTNAPSTYLDITGDKFRLRSSKTPSSATDTGNAGDICWDANYIYICTATNTWKRSAIATW